MGTICRLDAVFLDDEHGDLFGGEGEPDVDQKRQLAAAVVVKEDRDTGRKSTKIIPN